jgi:hypothetical protein
MVALFTPARRSLLEIPQPPFFVLTDQAADVLTGSAPVTGIDLALDVVFESFGKRQGSGNSWPSRHNYDSRERSFSRQRSIIRYDPQLAVRWQLLQQ